MAINKVQKRNGAIVDFNSSRITMAIYKALNKIDSIDKKISSHLTDKVIEQLINNNFAIPTIEEIQDIVEKTLIKEGYPEEAKNYILYREKRTQSRKAKNVVIEVEQTISEYLDKLDWRVNANSNQGFSLGGLILNTSGKVTANYWLSHVYPSEIGDAHRNGDIHIHDLDMLSGYCAGWSLRILLEEGFNGVEGKVESAPPKHLTSAISQMVNFMGTLQNEWAGAQSFSSFDTYLAPFVKKYCLEIEEELKSVNATFNSNQDRDEFIYNKTYKYVYQNIQSFVFNLNVPSRWGTQSPFTNVTFDLVCPEDLKNHRLKIASEDFSYTFGELQNEMNMIVKAFIEVMLKGDVKGRIFTFPIPTYNITSDFDWDNPNADLLFEMTAKYGLPYFQNFINSDLKPQHIRSMCCRLQLDLNELLLRGNGLFGSAEMTGSIGVVTINTARIGYQSKGDKELFLNKLSNLMELAKISLEIKRKKVQLWLDNGLYHYTRRYLKNLNNHFSTIGINGLNEAIVNFSQNEYDISDPRGKELAEEILDFTREKLTQFQNETNNLYNLEATPAEGATYRFAKEDKKLFPKILQPGSNGSCYYTNSSQLPVNYTDDYLNALIHQESLQTKYTGGTVFHLYLGERVSDSKTCKKLVKKILTRFRIPYLTISPTFSICPKHGYIQGEHQYCPICDNQEIQPITNDNGRNGHHGHNKNHRTSCEIWTRVMGYHRPVQNFNLGKKSEHQERVYYKV